MERDTRSSNLLQRYQDSLKGRCRPEDKINEMQYQEMKLRIEWDIAWRIFDHVNENNNTKKDIDLNCLDINEAISITKQTIYDIALDLSEKQQGYMSSLFCMNSSGDNRDRKKKSDLHQVLSIKCADDHFQIID